MSTFWSVWITVITLGSLAGCWWLLYATRKIEVHSDSEDEDETTGHDYDGIFEYDNPLPKWWFNMFIASIIFALIYLALYPGLGSYPGLLKWTSHGQWEESVQKAEQRYAPLYAKYMDMPVEEVIASTKALKMGGRLFSNNCAICHGSDGRGNHGFPNLTDNDWLYGGSAEAIKQSITFGRSGTMPAWGDVIGADGVNAVAEYLFKLGGREHDTGLAEAGGKTFATFCAACHGADATGGQAVGAPNLTDGIWLYGGSPALVRHSIRNGRSGNQMPAHGELLNEGKIHLLAAYVYQLSKNN